MRLLSADRELHRAFEELASNASCYFLDVHRLNAGDVREQVHADVALGATRGTHVGGSEQVRRNSVDPRRRQPDKSAHFTCRVRPPEIDFGLAGHPGSQGGAVQLILSLSQLIANRSGDTVSDVFNERLNWISADGFGQGCNFYVVASKSSACRDCQRGTVSRCSPTIMLQLFLVVCRCAPCVLSGGREQAAPVNEWRMFSAPSVSGGVRLDELVDRVWMKPPRPANPDGRQMPFSDQRLNRRGKLDESSVTVS